MLRTLKRIGNDLLKFKNIELYATTFVAFAVAVISLISDALSDDVKIAVLLAGVGLLVFKLSEPKDVKSMEIEDVLKDRQSYGKFGDFIRGGSTLWIYGASNINVLRNIEEIKREILDRGGSVRLLMQDPQATHSMEILYQQLDKLHDLRRDIETAQDTVRRTQERLAHERSKGTLEYRLLAYSPGFSMTVVDPDGRNGRLVVEFYGFENDSISERMHIEIRRSESLHWFEHWEKQYRLMWEKSRQPD